MAKFYDTISVYQKIKKTIEEGTLTMNKQLSIKDAILYAVNAVVSNPWYFVKLWLAWMGFSLLILLTPILILSLMMVAFISPVFIAIGYFMLYVFGLFACILPIKLLLRYYDQGAEPFSLRLFLDQFSFKMILKLLGAAILFNLMIFAGLILLIIPGIYLLVKFSMVFFTLIDTNCGVIEAFRRSYQKTKNNFWRITGLLLIAALLWNLIITIPIAMLMIVHGYRQLSPA